jgi:hypothetical protein
MSEIKYEPFKTIPYSPNATDSQWNSAVDCQIEMACLRGDLTSALSNPVSRRALCTALNSKVKI